MPMCIKNNVESFINFLIFHDISEADIINKTIIKLEILTII
jgi:hypothetical protein